MPAFRPQPPRSRARLIASASDDFAVQQVSEASQRSSDQLHDRSVIVVDLLVGANVINHRLGRVPSGATVSPTVADATWAWALTSRTSTQMTVTCVGAAQPGATVEVF